ncbi:hypothetical protein BDR06DRAFT_401806 [Suillus hirtellus]|nr:hypothetical protein BDR06DRAFT_401806 [Suillus hirtellus]
MHFASLSIVPAGIVALRNFILILLAIYKYITGRRSPAPTRIGRCDSSRARHHATLQRSCKVSSNFPVSHILSDTSSKCSSACPRTVIHVIGDMDACLYLGSVFYSDSRA